MAEVGKGREKGFEVEDDRAGEREAAQGLPVNAKMDAGERERGGPARSIRGLRDNGAV